MYSFKLIHLSPLLVILSLALFGCANQHTTSFGRDVKQEVALSEYEVSRKISELANEIKFAPKSYRESEPLILRGSLLYLSVGCGNPQSYKDLRDMFSIPVDEEDELQLLYLSQFIYPHDWLIAFWRHCDKRSRVEDGGFSQTFKTRLNSNLRRFGQNEEVESLL